MHLNYTRCYQALDVLPGTEWQDIRAAYRNLVQKWHPDRFPDDLGQRSLAEEKLKEVTEAYRVLEQYYRKNGMTPGASTPTSEPAPDYHSRPEPAPTYEQAHPFDQGPIPQTGSPDHTEYPSPQRRTTVMTAVLVGIVLLIIFLLMDDTPTIPNPPTGETQQSVVPDTTSNVAAARDVENGPHFTVGSTLGEVYSIQGIPTKIDGNTWHYGESTVYFTKGSVTHWQSHPDTPLKANLTGADAATRYASFGHGSSKTDVRTMQGNPSRETDTVWEYGTSKIYFRGDRVTGWHESPLFPLKASNSSK